MPARRIKPNTVLRLRPKSPRKKIRPKWPIQAKKLVAVAVPREVATNRSRLVGRSHGLKFYKGSLASKHSIRWVFALVQRTGQNEFVVLKRSVAAYNDPNLDAKTIKKLVAVEFGLEQVPEMVGRIKAEEIDPP